MWRWWIDGDLGWWHFPPPDQADPDTLEALMEGLDLGQCREVGVGDRQLDRGALRDLLLDQEIDQSSHRVDGESPISHR